MKTNANRTASAEPSINAAVFAGRVHALEINQLQDNPARLTITVAAEQLTSSTSNSSKAAFFPRSYCFLIVLLLFRFALLTPTASLAQQPATMSATSVAKLPFSPGLTLGDTLYVSGHLGVDPAVGKAPADPEEEARQVLHSVELTLKDAGMSMDDLVYVEIYCTDLKLYGVFNKAYASTLKSPYPARDFIGVKDLLFGAHFEMMGIAVRNASQNKAQPLAVK
jgi:2-iminobutanoate/2-iminopropanoate deaminase